jgi:hypothetical protein
MPVRSLPMRALRSLGLLTAGALAGLATAGALLKRALPSRGDPESDEIALAAVFNGAALRSRSTAFRGGSLFCWFGGVALDLREATLAPSAALNVTCVLGGVAIRVPAGWRVESNVIALASGVATNVPTSDDPEAPRLVVEGVSVLGGVAVGTRDDE